MKPASRNQDLPDSPAPSGPPVHGWEDEWTGNSLDLRELLAALRRNVWLILATSIVCTGIAGYLAMQETQQYRAGATLRMEDRRSSLAGRFEFGYVDWLAWRTDPLTTESALLRENREVAGAAVDREGLRLQIRSEGFSWHHLEEVEVHPDANADTLRLRFLPDQVVVTGPNGRQEVEYGTPVDVDGVRFTITGQPKVQTALVKVVSRDGAISSVLRGLRATPRKETSLIELNYTATDGRLAQKVVNAVAEEFQAYGLNRYRKITVQRREFIAQQIKEMETLLNEAYRTLSDFRSERQMYGQQGDGQEQLYDLKIRREELVADRDLAASLVDDARFREGDDSEEWIWSVITSPAVASNRIIGELYAELSGYKKQRQQMVAGEWGTWSDHPDVQRLDGLIASTEAKLVEALRHHVKGMDARISALEKLHDRGLESLRTLADSEMEETWLVHEVETIRSIAEQLRMEYQRARFSEAAETPQFSIMNLATSPGKPLGTRGQHTILLGLLLGIALGGGGAFVRENLDNTIRRREQIESVFGVPGLAVIPRITPLGSGRRFQLFGRRNREDYSEAGSDAQALALVHASDLLSSSAEAYRVLRTNLIFSHAVQRIHSLLVTSASAGEGKTTTAANLAIAVAQQQGLRVALIDGDLRKPRLHKMFGVSKSPGLTDFLIRTHSIADVVHQTPVPGLYLIPAGTLPPNPADLLGISRMKKLIDTLAGKIDLIILDSPPILAAADSTILGLQVDSTLLVVHAGRTDQSAVHHAVDQLTTVGGRVAGMVLNDPDEKVRQTYYSYYSNYRYAARDRDIDEARAAADEAPVD